MACGKNRTQAYRYNYTNASLDSEFISLKMLCKNRTPSHTCWMCVHIHEHINRNVVSSSLLQGQAVVTPIRQGALCGHRPPAVDQSSVCSSLNETRVHLITRRKKKIIDNAISRVNGLKQRFCLSFNGFSR